MVTTTRKNSKKITLHKSRLDRFKLLTDEEYEEERISMLNDKKAKEARSTMIKANEETHTKPKK